MPADRALRILHLEDDPLDAELVRQALEQEGIPAVWNRVQSREEFLSALDAGEYDLIISDYSMPSFDGLTALGLAREKRPDIPFIYLSGTIGEERAVEALLNGATDYVLKDRLFRLGAVIRRSMRDAALRVQKKLVEEQLHATFARLQRLVAASPAVIYSASFPLRDDRATFVSENVKARLGYEPVDFTARAGFWMTRVHPEDREKVLARMRSLGSEEPAVLSYRFLHADGSLRWLEDRMNLVRDAEGRPVEIVGSWVDVTDIMRMREEMSRMEEQFHQAQKLEAIGSLAGGVAHDFNNILMVILSYSSFLLSKLPPDSELRRDVEEIRKAGNRAADLTHQLLAFSRKETLNPRNISPGEALRNLSKMLGRLIGDNIRLSLKLCEDQGFIVCDATQFDQIIINLVVNARDAMPGGGEITIETNVLRREAPADGTTGTRDEYLVSVGDTGTGIPSDIRDRIFEPFFTTKPAGKGTGLGLAMVYGAVQQNQGRIEVESEPGKGTLFRIAFPLHSAPMQSGTSTAAAAGPAGETLAILLVEDDTAVRHATARLLESLGFSVIEASGGEQALDIFGRRSGGIDVVISDVSMPEMSGPELARRLRRMKPDTRVIFCTGYMDELAMVERELGSAAISVPKPFDGETILAKIRSVLGPSRGEAAGS